ncbi:MAG: RNA polymerase sigma factor [Verrucomicrobiaceae bacterium]|nr:RNA polymerase sigma factor [Verrucomicrobiaceae bacterium]
MTSTDTSTGFPGWNPTGARRPSPSAGHAAAVESAAEQRTDELVDLVERSRSGCHESYRRLVELHQDRIYRFCLGWVGNVEDAQEICQDTFVKAYSALPRARSAEHFSAWIYRIARNHCHDHHRSRRQRNASRNRPLHPDDGDRFVSPSHAPDETAVRSERWGQLEAGIASLPVPLREVLILCGIEGLSHEECSGILSCSRRAVEGRLYRARTQLSEWLERKSG